MTNPLLMDFKLPPFSIIQPEHIVPAITIAVNNCRSTIKLIENINKPYTWKNLVQPMAEADDKLNNIFGVVSHLNSVKDSLKLREAYEESLIILSEYNTWVSHHEFLYKAYCNLKDSPEYERLHYAQKKTIDNILRNFLLSGVHLNTEKKKRYGQITARLSHISTMYSNNVLDATMDWKKLIKDVSELSGIPDNVLSSAKTQAKIQGEEGWLLSLDMPMYLSIMMYADNSALRKEMYHAYSTRASDLSDNRNLDNSLIMKEQLSLRYELAQLLGYQSYADKSLETKMAENPKQVIDFLMNIVKYVHPAAKKELNELRIFTKKNFGISCLQSWDIAYYSEKYKQYLYQISDEQLRVYFPETRVLQGLFKVIKLLYGVTVKECNDVEVYHSDVRFFHFFNESGNLCGSVFFDLYVRQHKHSGAWVNDCVSRFRKSDGNLQKPVAYLNCNFNRPIPGYPALLTHDDVVTLFHECGHVLHHILTIVEAPGVSGIKNVPWDFIELPSQIMQKWCWEPEVLSLIGGHYETGQLLPKELLDNILAAKNYHSALFILRQLEFGLFDLRLHTESYIKKNLSVLEMLSEVRNDICVISYPEWNRFPHSFCHIFSGSYAAGYYSYLWAEVLATDAYSIFKKYGIFNRQIGQLFLNNILSRGASEEAINMFINFRGREPQINSMLEYYGLKEING